MKIHEREFIRYYLGGSEPPHVILDAPHGVGPSPLPHDALTYEIVRAVSAATGCPFIEATKNRSLVDLNRWVDPTDWDSVCAHVEYRQALRSILRFMGVLSSKEKVVSSVLLLAIHGMKDRNDNNTAIDMELGTMGGVLTSAGLVDWAQKYLAAASGWNVQVDQRFPGHPSLAVHIHGGDSIPGYKGYGNKQSIIQLEISNTLRTQHFPQLVDLLAGFVQAFERTRGKLSMRKVKPGVSIADIFQDDDLLEPFPAAKPVRNARAQEKATTKARRAGNPAFGRSSHPKD